MKCNKYQAPVLFATTAEQRDKEVERHEVLAEGHRKEISRILDKLYSEIEGGDQSRVDWLSGMLKHERLILKRYEAVIAELKALTF